MDTLDWPIITNQRDRMAHYWHRVHRKRYPLQEYYSAGNLGIAEALADFNMHRGQTLETHIRMRMKYHMMKMYITEEKVGFNPLAELHAPLANAGYNRILLLEIFTQLLLLYSLKEREVFLLYLLEHTWSEIAAITGKSIGAGSSIVWRMRTAIMRYIHADY